MTARAPHRGNGRQRQEFFADSQRLKSYTTPGGAKHRPQENGQVVTMMRTTVSTQPQIIIVVCCITLRLYVYRRTVR